MLYCLTNYVAQIKVSENVTETMLKTCTVQGIRLADYEGLRKTRNAIEITVEAKQNGISFFPFLRGGSLPQCTSAVEGASRMGGRVR